MMEVPMEEYNDLTLMRRFIYENGLVFQYEMFLDILAKLEDDEQIIDI